MLTCIEQLIEAVTYAQEDGCDWWEVFDDITEAYRVLRQANKATAEENEITCLLAALDMDGDFYDVSTAEEAYRQALWVLEEQLGKCEST